MKKKICRTSGAEAVLKDLEEAVCDTVCTKLDGTLFITAEEQEKICAGCRFAAEYEKLSGILGQIDQEYLKVCKDNDQIKRRLKLYDLCSDVP